MLTFKRIILLFSESCLIEESNEPCVFPFEIGRKSYNTCISTKRGRGLCGTVAKVTAPNHVGICGQNCPGIIFVHLSLFKRPCRYIFEYFGYTFSMSHFLILSIDFDLKPHGKPIPVNFWAQKGVF